MLKPAARDLRFLLNREYPRREAIILVGNRYSLTTVERDVLHRGVFGRVDAQRRMKKILVSELGRYPLIIDGHNILITLESALKGLPLILADDGFIRDISRTGRRYMPSSYTQKSLALICDMLLNYRPPEVLFLLDAPMSRSGELAATVRNLLSKHNLTGTAKAVPVPETLLRGPDNVVATSDSAIINTAERVFDLAGHVLRYRLGTKDIIRLN